ncbi:ATPase, AAA domain containing protein [Acanthamoeba castellanii str. Neff]|uniref:ATPase, AAA domain containing protein n=1 Tax=Acanthamoeba castellanii (strain ATCC 30010 / Neff) TaxID=1257118 RepID=L8HH30_ACACF|nr:ATPase, AAA domain containing protein [Acanthamoeba castellanii str. Neff]ELR24879.1 ATPase, AAA domain containing protein [Acanthamoeba castellanii str. Neff]
MEQLIGTYLKGRMGALADNDVFSGGLMLLVVGVVAAYVHWLSQELWERAQRQFLVSLEVRKEDEAFAWLMKWLAVQTEKTNGRELSMLTTRENDRDRYDGSEAATKPTLHFGPAPGLHFLRYRGKWVTVERTVKDNQFGGNGLELQETLKLTTYGRDPQILKDLAHGAMNYSLGEELGKTLIFQPKYGWGGTWRKLMAIEKRAIGSVHFPTGTLEKLLADVREFFAMRDWYKRRGIPHRRGVMLYGPPGNGKSSFAAALAGELGLNLCVCSLANSSLDDDELQEYMRKMPKGSILLLEDIDAAFVHRKKNVDAGNSSNKVTFSGLLNALDGAVAFEGSLVLMTTNHREKLDPALTRPGRVDFALYVGLANRDQIERLFAYFYQPWEAEAEAEAEEGKKEVAARQEHIERERERVRKMAIEFARLVSMASIQGYLLRFKLDPQAAIDNVDKFVVEELARMSEEEARRKKEAEEEEKEKEKEQEEKKEKEKEEKEASSSSTSSSSSSSATSSATADEVGAKENEEKRPTDAVVSA